MDQLILHVNKLQEVCSTVGQGKIELDLPQIVVVGSQSSGKTSVLESFVGKDFLPRGQNIVTRRPLILQLIHVDEGTQEPETGAGEWAIFGHHDPPRIYTDFEEVKDEVEAETDRLTGSSKNISPVPIVLKVFSPNVVTLTLVDLPGLVTVPVEGQPPDIGKKIKELVRSHIQKPSTIILAVTPATNDLATSHALKMAKEYDPTGDRTLAVLTKLDAVEKADQEAKAQALSGQILKVKLGIIGVINRSQNDVVAKKSMLEKKREEKQYLRQAYPQLANEHGTDYLANRLSSLLTQHILKWIPEIQAKILEGVSQHKAIVEACGYGNDMDKASVMFGAIDRFTTGLKEAVEGLAHGRHTKDLVAGARIYQLFFATFPSKLDAVAEPLVNNVDIMTAVKNAIALRPHLFTPHRAFENLVRDYIEEIRTPSLQVAEDVRAELHIILEKNREQLMATLQLYPNLMRRIVEETEAYIQARLGEAKKMIENHVDNELGYINTNHVDFDQYFNEAKLVLSKVGAQTMGDGDHTPELTPDGDSIMEDISQRNEKGGTLTPNFKDIDVKEGDDKSPRPSRRGDNTWKMFVGKNKPKPRGDTIEDYLQNDTDKTTWFADPSQNKKSSKSERKASKQYNGQGLTTLRARESAHAETLRLNDTSVIATSLKSYTRIVRKTALDMVPKIIVSQLVNKTTDSLALHLHAKLNRPDNFDDLLAESPDVLDKRRKAEKMLAAFDEANTVLNEIKYACSDSLVSGQ